MNWQLNKAYALLCSIIELGIILIENHLPFETTNNFLHNIYSLGGYKLSM